MPRPERTISRIASLLLLVTLPLIATSSAPALCLKCQVS